MRSCLPILQLAVKIQIVNNLEQRLRRKRSRGGIGTEDTRKMKRQGSNMGGISQKLMRNSTKHLWFFGGGHNFSSVVGLYLRLGTIQNATWISNFHCSLFYLLHHKGVDDWLWVTLALPWITNLCAQRIFAAHSSSTPGIDWAKGGVQVSACLFTG